MILFSIKRHSANIIHVLFTLFCLVVAIYIKNPHLLNGRAYTTIMLVSFAMMGLVVSFRTIKKNLLQLFILFLWLAVLGVVGFQEYEFQSRKQFVLNANGEDGQHLAKLGQHLVIGYDRADNIRELVRRGFIAGLFVTRRNIDGKHYEAVNAELSELQALRQQAGFPPLIIASDQEGGPVSRLSPPLPKQAALASLLTPGLSEAEIEQRARAYGLSQGSAMSSLGINVNFSPVVDLKPEQMSSTLDFHTRITERAIASDPKTVAQVALAYSQGLLAGGILPTVKHFPGLGGVAEDTHHFSTRLKLPLAQLNTHDWYPFRQVLSQTPALLMIAHVIIDTVDSELPASLSEKVITGIIRKGWGHDGLLITDDMSMAAVYDLGLCKSSVQSLNAGIDLLLVSYDWEKVYPVLACLLEADKAGRLRNLSRSHTRLGGIKLAGVGH